MLKKCGLFVASFAAFSIVFFGVGSDSVGAVSAYDNAVTVTDTLTLKNDLYHDLEDFDAGDIYNAGTYWYNLALDNELRDTNIAYLNYLTQAEKDHIQNAITSGSWLITQIEDRVSGVFQKYIMIVTCSGTATLTLGDGGGGNYQLFSPGTCTGTLQTVYISVQDYWSSPRIVVRNEDQAGVFWNTNGVYSLTSELLYGSDYTMRKLFYASTGFVLDIEGYEGDWPSPITTTETVRPTYENLNYFNGILSFTISDSFPSEEVNDVGVSYSYYDQSDPCQIVNYDLGHYKGADVITISAPPTPRDENTCSIGYPPHDWRTYTIRLYFGYDGGGVLDTEEYIYETTVIHLTPTPNTIIIGGGPEDCDEDGNCDYSGDVQTCENATGPLAMVCPIMVAVNNTTSGSLALVFVPLFSGFLVPTGMTTCPNIGLNADVSIQGHDFFSLQGLPSEICDKSDTLLEAFPILVVVSNFIISLMLVNIIIRLVNMIFNKDADVIEDSLNRNEQE